MVASIKVALELDDSKYTQKINAATAAADNFTKKATDGAAKTTTAFGSMVSSAQTVSSALDKLESGFENLSGKADTLVRALAGFAAAEFINSLLEGAGASKDMSEAFGLSIESVLELQAAFAAAGRGPAKMNQALATLGDAAVTAKQGNSALRESFLLLGISMEDLEKGMTTKEMLVKISETMTSGNATAAQLSATYDVLSKVAKGFPWGDFNDALGRVNGTMGPAAESTKTLDAIMKKLEASAGAVRREFIILIEPVAKYFEEMTSNGAHAKEIAELIAAAIALIGSSMVISGLVAVGSNLKLLTGWFVGLFTATQSETYALAENTAAMIANAAILRAGIAAKVASLEASLASARAYILETAAAEGNAAATAELAAARRILLIQSSQLVASTAALAEANGVVAASTLAAGGSAAAATGFFGGLAAIGSSIIAFFTAPAWGAIAIAIAAITVVLSAGTIIWRAFSEEIKGAIGWIGDFIISIGSGLASAFNTMDDALTKIANKIRELRGQPPIEIKQTIEGPYRTPGMGPQARAQNGSPDQTIMVAGVNTNIKKEGDRPATEGVATGDPMKAQNQALRDNFELQKLSNGLAETRLRLQMSLIGATEAERIAALARYDDAAKFITDLQKMDAEIAKVQAQMTSGQKGTSELQGQLNILKQQRAELAGQLEKSSFIKKEELDLAELREKQRRSLLEFKLTQEQLVHSYNDANTALYARATFETSLLGLGEEEIAQRRAVFDLTEKTNNQIKSLQSEQEKLKLNIDIDPSVGKKIQVLEDTITNLRNQLGFEIPQAKTSAKSVVVGKNQEEIRLFNQELLNKATTDAISLEGELLKVTQRSDEQKIIDLETQNKLLIQQEILKRNAKLGPGESISAEEIANITAKVTGANQAAIDGQKSLNEKIKEFNALEEIRLFNQDLLGKALTNAISLEGELAKLTQSGNQQKITDLETQNKLLIQQEIFKRNAVLKPGESISAEEIAQITKDVTDANQAGIDGQQRLIDKGREFSTGWNKAWADYVENSRNAADQAKTYFDSFTKGFEDAIVSLVTNGKWSFKDFANSIIADFARIEAKKMLVNLMGTSSGEGGGGLIATGFNALKSIFGFAEGGNVSGNVPIMVGERGPELFVPKTAGSIIPNNAMAAGAGNTEPQQTIVNYNIQAVDASSFRSLVARDPSFIYAVTEQGRRSQPSRRMG